MGRSTSRCGAILMRPEALARVVRRKQGWCEVCSSRGMSSHLMVALACSATLGLGCEVRETRAQTCAGVTVDEQGDVYADDDPRALDDFRADVDPHGVWVEDEEWGTVWVPSDADPDFEPYVTAGHWTWDGDYVWVSDY